MMSRLSGLQAWHASLPLHVLAIIHDGMQEPPSPSERSIACLDRLSGQPQFGLGTALQHLAAILTFARMIRCCGDQEAADMLTESHSLLPLSLFPHAGAEVHGPARSAKPKRAGRQQPKTPTDATALSSNHNTTTITLPLPLPPRDFHPHPRHTTPTPLPPSAQPLQLNYSTNDQYYP